MKQKRTKHKR